MAGHIRWEPRGHDTQGDWRGATNRSIFDFYLIGLLFSLNALSVHEMTGHKEDDGITIREKDLPRKFVLKILGHCETKGLWGLKHTREPVDKMVKFARNHKLCLPIVQLFVTREGIFVLPLDVKKKLIPQLLDGNSEFKINVTIPKSEIKLTKNEKDDSKMKGHCFSIRAHFKVVRNMDKNRVKVKKKVDNLFSEGVKENVCKGCGREQNEYEKPERARTDVQLLEKYKKIDWRRHGIIFHPIDNVSYGVQDLVYTRVFSMIAVTDVKSRFATAGPPFVCHSFVCESHNTARTLTYALDAAFQAYGNTLRDKGRKD